MSLFRRKPKEDLDLSTVLARRGIPAIADIRAMQRTGRTRAQAVEYEFRLAYQPHGYKPVEVTVRQYLEELQGTGLEPGSQATILYDRQDAHAVMVTGSPRYKIVSEGVAVKVDGPASGLARPRVGPE